jgi:HEAT repeat protein
MDLTTLSDMSPWEWPEGTGKMLLDILRDRQAEETDRLLAAELAGDFTVINDELVEALLTILQSDDASEKLRGTAAISLGPVLDQASIDGFDDPDDVPIAEETFKLILESFRKLYTEADLPNEVRRRILEASVRAPQGWHQDAVRVAYAADDEDWNLTAVFSMRWVRGFDDQILEALKSENEDIHYQAVCAAGNWGLDEAWSHIAALITSEETDKDLLLAAIEALPYIRPEETGAILVDLIDSEDEDIVDAVHEALVMAEGVDDLEYDDDDLDDWDDEPVH